MKRDANRSWRLVRAVMLGVACLACSPEPSASGAAGQPIAVRVLGAMGKARGHDRVLELSLPRGGADAAVLFVLGANGRLLAAPAALEATLGMPRRLHAIVADRDLEPSAGPKVAVILVGSPEGVRGASSGLAARLRAVGSLASAMRVVRGDASLHGVLAQQVALPLEVGIAEFDPSAVARAEQALIEGDPARALAIVDEVRGAAPEGAAADADAIASEAAFAIGRVLLAKTFAARGLALAGLRKPGLEARLLRAQILADAESTDAPPALRGRLRASEAERTDPLERAKDLALDLKLAVLRDRSSSGERRAPGAARELIASASALDRDSAGAVAADLCRAGSYVDDGLAAIELGTRAAGERIIDRAYCAITRGDAARASERLAEADRAYTEARDALGGRELPRLQREAWFSAATLANARGQATSAFTLARKAYAWVDFELAREADLSAREALLSNTLGYYGSAERFGIRAGDYAGAIASAEWGKGRGFGAVLRGIGNIDEAAAGAWLALSAETGEADAGRLAALARSLGEGDAAISYTLLATNENGRFELALGVVTREAITAELVETPDEFFRDVAELARAVEGNDGALAAAVGGRLYRTLLLPIERRLAGKTRLFVSPHLSLQSLPWVALHDGARFVVERFAFARVPPLLFAERDPEDDRVTLGRARRWMLATDPPHAPLARLPGLDMLADGLTERLHPPVVLRGESATPERLIEGLAGVDALFYGGHASYDAARPLRSALLVAPSPSGVDRVDAASILGLSRRLDVVVLIGCETSRMAGKRPSYSDENIGLARAFLAGGARHVVGALWPVVDRDAEDFVLALFAESGAHDIVRSVAAAQSCLASGRCPNRGIASWGSYLVDAR